MMDERMKRALSVAERDVLNHLRSETTDRRPIVHVVGSPRVDPLVQYLRKRTGPEVGYLIDLGKRLQADDDRHSGRALILDSRGGAIPKLKNTSAEEGRRQRQRARRDAKAAAKAQKASK
jgi:hypothetical protein